MKELLYEHFLFINVDRMKSWQQEHFSEKPLQKVLVGDFISLRVSSGHTRERKRLSEL